MARRQENLRDADRRVRGVHALRAFQKAKGLEVNLVSLSHANYGGNAGIWRILEVLQRNKVRATVDVNGLAVQKWPDAVKALHDAGNEIAATAPPTTST